ncbi:hypothetical protein [Agrobacterium vitis]
MRETRKITLIIAPSREAAALTCEGWRLPPSRLRDHGDMRIITNVDGLRGWCEGTACIFDFALFGRDDVRLKDLTKSMLASGRLRRPRENELRELRGEMV